MDPTYSVGTSNKEVERKLNAGLFWTETACDSQNESHTESTRASGTKTVMMVKVFYALCAD